MEKTLLENPYIVSANLKRKLEFDARETSRGEAVPLREMRHYLFENSAKPGDDRFIE